MYVGRLISLVNFHEMALQSIWWRDISKDPLFELLQAKFQLERTQFTFDNHLKRDWRAKKCSSIKTTRRPASRLLRWQNYELGYELIPHPPYSPDLAPWLLSVPKLKNLARWEERQMRKSLSPSMSILQTLREPTSNDYQTWTMRPFWLKFGLKGFEEWIFRVDLSRHQINGL